MTAVQFVWTCKDIYGIPLGFTTQLVQLFFTHLPTPIPSPLHFWGRWAGAGSVRHAPAHSFMSDTELSHCEQLLCGFMLTNELSSASSEKSSQSSDHSRRSEPSVFNSVRRETTTLYKICTT